MSTYTWDPITGTYILSDDQSATLATDQSDYSPGQTVQVSGSFAPGTTIMFAVAHDTGAGADGIWGTADDVLSYDLTGTGQTWTVTADASGAINTSWFVNDDALNQNFELIGIQEAADGTFTGPMTTTFFTDKLSVPSNIDSANDIANLTDHGTAPEANTTLNANGGIIIAKIDASGTGTGAFDAFLRVQGHAQDTDGNPGTEEGFNTNADPLPLDDVSGDKHTHAIQLQNVALVDANGNATTDTANGYREFILDIAQSGTNPFLSLDDLKIFDGLSNSTINGNLADLSSAASKLYDLNLGAGQFIALQDLNAGNGQDDYRVLIPNSFFAGKSATDFIYLYSKFGYQGDGWSANSSFEEWGVTGQPTGGGGPEPHAALSLTKDTICPDPDHESVANGTLLAGKPIEWTYTVQDVGDNNTFVQNLTLTDDQLGTLYSNGVLASNVTLTGDNGDGILEKGETWVFTATGTTVDTSNLPQGIYTNTGTIAGDGFSGDPKGSPIETDPGLSAVDISAYTGVTVTTTSITIDKEVSVDGGKTWVDSDSATGPTLLAGHGDPEYRFIVSNSSDVGLPVHLVDSTLGITLDINVAAGGSTTVDTFGGNPITASWNAGQNTNTVDASSTFTDACDNSVTSTDSASANYFGAAPAMTIEKDIVCPDDGDLLSADKAVNLLKDAAGTVTYEIIVKNTGNVDLAAPTVSDPILAAELALVTPLQSGGSGSHTDNILQVGESWTYTVTADWAASAVNTVHTNTAEATDSFTDSAGNVADGTNTATLDVMNSASYFGLNPHMTLDKLTNGLQNGGNVLAGSSVTWTYTLTNDGNVDLTVSHLTGLTDDSGTPGTGPAAVDDFHPAYVSGDVGNDGILSVGEVWTFTASGTAQLGSYTNTAKAVAASVTDDCGDSTTPCASDSSGYTGTFTEQGGTLTQGFWGSHTDAWDGVPGHESNPTKSAFASGVLSALDINPRHDGNLLLGDANGNGKADDAHDLLISDKLAAAIESSSTSGDARIIMLQQAIAAQLNIDNGKAEPVNLIDEAVMWLTKATGSAWAGVGVNIAQSGTVSDGFGNQTLIVAENGSHTALAGSSVSTSSAAWHTFVDVTDPSSGITDWNGGKEADGEGLKNALMWWNDGHLVTSSAGQVAYDTNGTAAGGINPATVNLNTLDEFWLTLHQQGSLTGIA